MSGLKYQSKLDGLRFIAIFMVLVEHFAYFLNRFITAGYYGVNLFFVLSGFLITSILIKDDTKSFKSAYLKFLGRRVLRIFPIYYLAILFFIVVNTPYIFTDLPYLLSYTFNYHIQNIDGWNREYAHFWSLSAEEQFYLFFPVIALLLRRRLGILKIVCLGFILLASMQILFNVFSWERYNYTGLLTNMAPLSFGALGAIYIKQGIKNDWVFKNIFLEISVLTLLVITIITTTSWTVRMLACPILNLYLVMKAYNYNFSINLMEKFISNKTVVYIGRISYGIYIYHGITRKYFATYIFDPVWNSIPFKKFGFLSKIEFNPWVVSLPLYTFVAIGFASLSYKYIEAPIIALKDKLFAS